MTRLLAVVTLLAALAVTGAASSQPWGSENGRLAFQTANLRLVVASLDGSGSWPISFDRSLYKVAWSPDGAQLAGASNGHIVVMNPDGSGIRQLTSGPEAVDETPTWSPDGSKLAFARDTLDSFTIFTVGADGTGLKQLAPGGCEMDPAWSPTGTKIAFTGCGGLFASGIWTMNADGTGPIRIVDDGSHPTWSPDGSRIAFSRGAPADIYSIAADGTGERQLTSSHLDDADPAWSPDGTQIAFLRLFQDDQVIVMNADGSGERAVAVGGNAPAWQPLPSAPPGCSSWGTEQNDLFSGGPGDDVVCGLNGDDHLSGGEGEDVVRGGDGKDHIVGGPGSDLLAGGPGDDVIDARDGEPDVVTGGPGVDTAMVDPSDRVVNVEHVLRPEPRNLARGRPVTASMFLSDAPPEMAVDGDRVLWWSAFYAPQWIEIDLGRPRTFRTLQLVVAQNPPGETEHVVSGRASATDPYSVLHLFNGYTQDPDVLSYTSKRPWRNIRYVRVETLKSPSWVAWKEIRVLR